MDRDAHQAQQLSVWGELERLGEPEVRRLLAGGDYDSIPSKRALVIEWLGSKDSARREAREERMLDAIRWARHAAYAAYVAAIAAIAAAVIPMIR